MAGLLIPKTMCRASVARKMHLSASYVRDTWFRGVATLQLLISSGIN